MAIRLKTEKNVEYVPQGSLLQKRFEFAHVLVISTLASDFERDFFHAVKQGIHDFANRTSPKSNFAS